MEVTFESPIEDKPETPGETPDPQICGLGGQRPLGLRLPPEIPPQPLPCLPPPLPPVGKKRAPMTPPPLPPRLDFDDEVS